MAGEQGAVLPYRTTGDDLVRFVEARARGRDVTQIQALNFSAPGFQGTQVAAVVLGMLDPEGKDLTEAGREFALAGPDQKRGLLLRGMRAYDPYGLLLEAIFARPDHAETPLDWILTWWGTHDYGNSQTNRDEGSSAFAKFVEFAGLGTFVPGRRGHPTRIRWDERAAPEAQARPQPVKSERPIAAVTAPPAVAEPAMPAPPPPATAPAAAAKPPVQAPKPITFDGRNSMVLTLGPGRTVDLSLPAQVTAAEKERLLSLINLFISAPGE